MKERKKLKRVLTTIGIILVLLMINGVYKTYKRNADYESTEAICTIENKYYR